MENAASFSDREEAVYLGRATIRGEMAHPTDTSPDETTKHDVTALLRALAEGHDKAWDALLPVVYGELHGMAHRQLGRERADHTLSTTALVHEAYLKLLEGESPHWDGRNHFFAVASRAMRQILTDYAKARNRQKRGGGAIHISVDDVMPIAVRRSDELIALDEALTALDAVNPRQCRIVECRFFSGMSIEDTAQALGISVTTVKRDWVVARAWLNQALSDGPQAP
jgi:RNA polymerase sigma factor (TIGR02999 family)